MKILVQKFGGTSVATPENRRLAARKVIKAQEQGLSPVVIVSAMGRSGDPYATDTLLKVLADEDQDVKPAKREKDMLLACGEFISAVIFAQTLKALGCKSIALTGGQAGIITDSEFNDARIMEIRTDYLHQLIGEGYVPVICGFQGVNSPDNPIEAHAITTLGRGGSDTTGSAIGVALNALAVEIYTDVDGVKTADPRAVPNAKTLNICTYEEVSELAHQGAKVVHPRAAEIAMDHNIPLWVKSTFTDDLGTRIAHPHASEGAGDYSDLLRRRVTGIASTGRVAYIRLELQASAHKPIIEREVFRMMAQAGVNIYFVTYSPTALSFAVPRELYLISRDLLDGMVIPIEHDEPDEDGKTATYYIFKYLDGTDLAYRVQRPLLKSLEKRGKVVDIPSSAIENCTMVSVVASSHRRVPGVICKIMEILHKAKINVYQIADSEMSVSCLISEGDVKRAVQLLHEQLFDQ
jgi:aspartate kinase